MKKKDFWRFAVCLRRSGRQKTCKFTFCEFNAKTSRFDTASRVTLRKMSQSFLGKDSEATPTGLIGLTVAGQKSGLKNMGGDRKAGIKTINQSEETGSGAASE